MPPFQHSHPTQRYVPVSRRLRTNQAESYFSRLRRAEFGQHRHVSGKYLGAYAVEVAWREDRRRVSNGGLHQAATAAALARPISRVWVGYWQR